MSARKHQSYFSQTTQTRIDTQAQSYSNAMTQFHQKHTRACILMDPNNKSFALISIFANVCKEVGARIGTTCPHLQNLNLPDISIAISSPQYLSVYSSELAAIDASISYLHHLAQHAYLPPLTTVRRFSFRPPNPPSPWTTKRLKPSSEYYLPGLSH